MDENNGAKLTGIRQIVRLKEILQKWQSVTLGSKSDSPQLETRKHGGIISPAINKRLMDVKTCDSDEENCQSPEPPPDVPKGYLAVYVGPELRRFIIPTSYLSHSLFKVLLEKAEEEFGFDHSGALTIPCEVETFKFLLKCMENQHKDIPDDSSGTLLWCPSHSKSHLNLKVDALFPCSCGKNESFTDQKLRNKYLQENLGLFGRFKSHEHETSQSSNLRTAMPMLSIHGMGVRGTEQRLRALFLSLQLENQ